MKNLITYNLSLLVLLIIHFSTSAQLNIEQIEVKPTKNKIEIQCSFNDVVDSLITENGINYTIKSFNSHSDTCELAVLSINKKTESNFTLTVQAALTDAIYTSEERTFIVEYANEAISLTAERKAVLGSFIQLYDLRPYTFTNTYKTGKKSLLLCLFLLVLLIVSIPIHHKFFFKKNNVKKYKSIKAQFPELTIDPYTYEVFQDEHDVVLIEGKILLLETWKTLSENEEIKNKQDYIYLFHKKEKGSFFNPSSTLYQYLHNGWFGMLSACIALLLFTFLQHLTLETPLNFLPDYFNVERQMTKLLEVQIILGACFGLCLYTISSLAVLPWNFSQNPVLHVLKNTLKNTLTNTLAGTFCVALIFLEATLLGIYLNVNHLVNVLIAWLFIGLNMGILTAFLTKNYWIKGVKKGLVAGLTAFAIYSLCFQLIKTELLGVEIACFLNLATFSALLMSGAYQTKDINSTVCESKQTVSTNLPEPSITNKI